MRIGLVIAVFAAIIFYSPVSFSNCSLTQYSSGESKVNVIELYTSEGCSSCPPADKWLNSLKYKKGIWKDFVALKFHVDYWNYLGWKDELSSNKYTRRQREYAHEWRSSQVYTPGFVLNGNEWGAFYKRNLPKKNKEKVGNLKVVNKGGGKFEIINDVVSGDLYSFLLGHGITNRILRGENRGETLTHNFVVLDMDRSSIKKGKNVARLDLSKKKGSDLSVVFVVTRGNSLSSIQAVGGCLKEDI